MRFRVRPGRVLLALALSALSLGPNAGCGALLYQVDVVSAERTLAEAEHAGAAEASPYEFYAAREYLAEAKHEASEAAYEDAMRYASRATELAREALSRTRSSGEAARTQRDTPRDTPRDTSAGEAR